MVYKVHPPFSSDSTILTPSISIPLLRIQKTHPIQLCLSCSNSCLWHLSSLFPSIEMSKTHLKRLYYIVLIWGYALTKKCSIFSSIISTSSTSEKSKKILYDLKKSDSSSAHLQHYQVTLAPIFWQQ